MKKLLIISVLTASFALTVFTQKIRTINVQTEPNAIVWVNDVRSGLTDQTGKLVVRVGAGANTFRVRANGFKETTQILSLTATDIKIALVRTTEPAELMFHRGEWEADKEKAIKYYQDAIKLRPIFPEAYLALAKTLNSIGETEDALKAVAGARKGRPVFPEASLVEGKIRKSDGDDGKAIAAFKRAIKEGKNFQPEAHKELGILYKDKAETFGSSGDYEQESATYKLASSELKTALVQLVGADPNLYELLGQIYEKMQRYPEAIAIYEEYLRLFPTSKQATTFRSYIVQVKKLMTQQ